MPRWRSFSEAERHTVASRYTAGESSWPLAAEYGVTPQTITRWVRECGLHVRTKREARALRTLPAPERFRAKYIVLPNGCWQWTAAVNSDGYGLFRFSGGHSAHQFSFQHFYGIRPSGGMEIDHICNNRACVNPEHLRASTHRANAQRGAGSYQRGKTHCKHGHEFTDKNTRWYARGRKRQCRECSRVRQTVAWQYALGKRGPSRWNGNKTHCNRGHEFTPENTYWQDGRRSCRQCRRMYQTDAWRRERAQPC